MIARLETEIKGYKSFLAKLALLIATMPLTPLSSHIDAPPEELVEIKEMKEKATMVDGLISGHVKEIREALVSSLATFSKQASLGSKVSNVLVEWGREEWELVWVRDVLNGVM